MTKEDYQHQLLQAIYEKGTLSIYDFTAEKFTPQSEVFSKCRIWANQLIRDKLARYADVQHTSLELTNFGRFWAFKGGYLAFLKEGFREKEMHKLHSKEELVEARLKLTHYRLWGFWLSLILSFVGFILSLLNLYLILGKGLIK